MRKTVAVWLLFVGVVTCLSACDGGAGGVSPLLMPPLPRIPPAIIEDTTPPETIIVAAPSRKIDYRNVRFEWTGSDDTTSVAALVYSFYLQGYDTAYSEFTSVTTKTYVNLPDGNYIFYVRARDKAGNIDPTPASVEFTVAGAPGR